MNSNVTAVASPASGAAPAPPPPPLPTVTITDENPVRFIHQISRVERECGTVGLDHNYQRNLSCRSGDGGLVSNAPTKTLFVTRTVRSAAAQTALDNRHPPPHFGDLAAI